MVKGILEIEYKGRYNVVKIVYWKGCEQYNLLKEEKWFEYRE